MILTLSSANELFWLGRYLVRADQLSQLIPFESDESALRYAHAFCLSAWNAQTLNELLLDPVHSPSLPANIEAIWQNILSVRGVLSEEAFIQLYSLSNLTGEDKAEIAEEIAACRVILAQEADPVVAFWQLGEAMEQLDMAIRLETATDRAIQQLGQAIVHPELSSWGLVGTEWESLRHQPSAPALYAFADRLFQLLEEGPCAS